MTTILRPAPRRLLYSTYQVLWTTVAAVVYATGVVGAFLSLPLQAITGLFLAASLLGASCALSFWALETIRPGRITWVGLATGVVLLVALGLSSMMGLAGLGVLMAVHLLAPGTMRRLRTLPTWSVRGSVEKVRAATSGETASKPAPAAKPPPTRRRTSHSAATQPAAEWPPKPIENGEPLAVPDHVGFDDLCLAWQSSFLALQRCHSVEARVRVVDSRIACLEELERLQPDAVHAWLADGARAASNPTKYLSS